MDANIRALAGALIRVVACGSLTSRPVTAEVLAGLYPDVTPRARSCARPRSGSCEASGVFIDELALRERAKPPAWPRQLA